MRVFNKTENNVVFIIDDDILVAVFYTDYVEENACNIVTCNNIVMMV